MIGIYIAGGISGPHLNPAISIMLCVYRGFPASKLFWYIFAQLVGSIIAAFLAFGLYRQNIWYMAPPGSKTLDDTKSLTAFSTFAQPQPILYDGMSLTSVVNFPRDRISGVTGFFNEVTGSAILAITVLAIGDDANAPPVAGVSFSILLDLHSLAFNLVD